MTSDRDPNLMYGGDRDFDAPRLKLQEESGMNTHSLLILRRLGVGPGDRVLDIGSGPHGTLGDAIEEMGATYTAYDYNHAFVESQAAQGHDVIEGRASEMMLHDDSVDVVHARFALGWFGDSLEQALQEILRAGTPRLRGAFMDYDYTPVDGPPEFMDLVHAVEPMLKQRMGFDTRYGSRLEDDVSRVFTQQVGKENFNLWSSRFALRADTDEEVQKFVISTVQSVQLGLRTPHKGDTPEVIQAKLEEAEALETLLRRALAAGITADNIRLPDVVSVRFWIGATTKQLGAVLLSEGRQELSSETFKLPNGLEITHFRPGWDEDDEPVAQRGRIFFRYLYTRAGYLSRRVVTPEGEWELTPEELEERTDPPELRARSDMVVAVNARDQIVAHARLARPLGGIASLPTGQKLLKAYGPEIFPEVLRENQVGEVIDAVGINQLATMASLLVCIRAAREAQLPNVLYGAVKDKVEPHLRAMFGNVMRPLLTPEGQPADVMVEGPGYRPGGIVLSTGYADTASFYREEIEIQRSRNTKNSRVIIRFCEQLDAL